MKIKPTFLCFILILLTGLNYNLFGQIDLPRASSAAGIWQTIGLTEVKINYSRPQVTAANGTDRTGAIWGQLVPLGMTPNALYGGVMPWRAGANENTIIHFSDDVTIEGQSLQAGSYGFHIVVGEDEEATLIFNKDINQWGSFGYDESQDALQVKIKTQKIAKQEHLRFTFSEITTGSAICALEWEEKSFPFKIEVNTSAVVMANLDRQLSQTLGFQQAPYVTAANYILNNDGDYQQGLEWVERAINMLGANYGLYKAKSDLLLKLEQSDASKEALEIALSMANLSDLYGYGQQLLGAQKTEEALEIFKSNHDKMKSMKKVADSDKFTVYAGLALGYRANKDLPTAIKHAKQAQEVAPTKRLKVMAANFVASLEKANQG